MYRRGSAESQESLLPIPKKFPCIFRYPVIDLKYAFEALSACKIGKTLKVLMTSSVVPSYQEYILLKLPYNRKLSRALDLEKRPPDDIDEF